MPNISEATQGRVPNVLSAPNDGIGRGARMTIGVLRDQLGYQQYEKMRAELRPVGLQVGTTLEGLPRARGSWFVSAPSRSATAKSAS